ncbi:hypothetical protein O1L44_24575 [Streptomyces noursei]|nr:hypothetical protein [Streptomyces noursei]
MRTVSRRPDSRTTTTGSASSTVTEVCPAIANSSGPPSPCSPPAPLPASCRDRRSYRTDAIDASGIRSSIRAPFRTSRSSAPSTCGRVTAAAWLPSTSSTV